MKWPSKIAASMAFKEGMRQAKSVISLEPIMKVDITVPEEYMEMLLRCKL